MSTSFAQLGSVARHPPDKLPLLTSALVDPERTVRLAAIEMLERMDDDADLAAPALAKVVERDDLPEVRRRAILTPPTEFKDQDGRSLAPPEAEGAELQAWRARMKTPQARTIYKERAATIEGVHALARKRGRQRFRVCGKPPRKPRRQQTQAKAGNARPAANSRARRRPQSIQARLKPERHEKMKGARM